MVSLPSMRDSDSYAFTGLGIDKNLELPAKEQALLCVGSTAESQASSAATAPDSLILLVIDTPVSAHSGGVLLRLRQFIPYSGRLGP